MSSEETLPPRKPNTFRIWLPRIWNAATSIVAKHPDIALVVFLLMFGFAAIL